MATTTWSADLRHPIYATKLLCEVANERGVATSDLLAGTGIAPADLDDPEAVVAASDEIVAVRRHWPRCRTTPGLASTSVAGSG